jgi:hypothetical protein
MYGGAKDDNAVWEYDGKDWKRCPFESGPASRKMSMAFDKTFRICVLFGGNPTEGHSDTWRWTGVDWLEVECKEAPLGLVWFALAWCESLKQILLVGETGDGVQRTCVYMGPRWHTIDSNVPRYRKEGASVASSPDGLLLHGGGKYGVGRDDTWQFRGIWSTDEDLFEGGWHELTNQCTPRFDCEEVMFYDSTRKRTYLNGTDWDETDGHDFRQHMWEWDGQSWKEVSCSVFPSRGERVAGHDEHRGIAVCLVRTGENEGRASEVWEWDGREWKQREIAGNLVAGVYYDPNWKEVFGLFWLGKESQAEVRSWNGKRWLTRASLELPNLEGYRWVAYDTVRRVLVILTEADNQKHTHATYEYDFKVLRKLDTAHAPYIRCARNMIAYPPQGEVLLAGCGFDYEEQMTFDYFWTYDGADWSMPRVLTKPTPRRSPLLAYDSARQTVVAFGGQDTWGWIFDTWEYSPDD